MSNFKLLYFKGHLQESEKSDFPVGPVVKTLSSNAEVADSIPGQRAHPTCLIGKKPKRKTKSNIAANSIKMLKMLHIKKILEKREIKRQHTECR